MFRTHKINCDKKEKILIFFFEAFECLHEVLTQNKSYKNLCWVSILQFHIQLLYRLMNSFWPKSWLSHVCLFVCVFECVFNAKNLDKLFGILCFSWCIIKSIIRMEHTAAQHIAHFRLSLFTYRVHNASRSTFDKQLKMHIARRSMIVKLILLSYLSRWSKQQQPETKEKIQ